MGEEMITPATTPAKITMTTHMILLLSYIFGMPPVYWLIDRWEARFRPVEDLPHCTKGESLRCVLCGLGICALWGIWLVCLGYLAINGFVKFVILMSK